MKIKTAELTGPALDWAVSRIEGHERAYSRTWSQGGPIIEREKIAVLPDEYSFGWVAHKCHFDGQEEELFKGPTPLIAAMRCFVASKMGDTIDIPEELA